MPNDNVRMDRGDLEGLPELTPPEGISIRKGTQEDVVRLAECLSSAFPEDPWTPERATSELLEHEEVSAVFLLEEGGEVVATASCKNVADDPAMGYVHWVGALQKARGRKLGYYATLAVLREFKAQGKTRAMLETQDPRIPAIKTYLKLGFQPRPVAEDHEERWKAILEKTRA